MITDLRSLRRILTLTDTPWARVAVAVTFGVLALGAAIGLAAVSAWLIARASQRPPILDLTIAVVAVRALGISRGVFRYFDRLFSHDVALYGVAKLREETYRRLAAAPTHVTVSLRRGDLLARFGADVDTLGDFVVRAFMPALTAIVVGVGSVILIGAFSPATAGVLAIMLLLAGTITPSAAAMAARRSEQATVYSRSDVSAATMSILDGADELRVSGRLEAMVAELAASEKRLRHALQRASWPAALAPAIGTLAMGASVVAALIFGGQELAAGTLAPVELAVIVLTPLAVFEAIDTLPAAAVQTLHSAAAARRLEAVLFDETDPSVQQPSEPDPLPVPSSPASGEPPVQAAELAIGYPGSAPILQGINLTLEAGQSLAIIGASGVGKTTLLATLAGLIPPAAGTVTIAGVDSRLLSDGEAAKTVIFTGEDAHVFDTTILENLRVARGDVSEAEAVGALERAGLGEFLLGLPNGVHTRLGENATMISGGERRRLLLARALLAPAPIMMLDEPGEHLDTQTADALVADMLALTRSDESGGRRSVIVVTHRPESVATADEVLRLE